MRNRDSKVDAQFDATRGFVSHGETTRSLSSPPALARMSVLCITRRATLGIRFDRCVRVKRVTFVSGRAVSTTGRKSDIFWGLPHASSPLVHGARDSLIWRPEPAASTARTLYQYQAAWPLFG